MSPDSISQTRSCETHDDVASPSSPVGNGACAQDEDLSSPVSSVYQREDKLPHDASVFVGSLPSNIDHAELTRLLTEHLSEHTQIKNIKVIRDSKGGVCAFVQCENAQSASSLIQTLHTTTPKLFLGRMLRFETARAFRTLLVSYRSPSCHLNRRESHQEKDETAMDELDLPYAMRIWKPRGSRFHNILYNDDALDDDRAHENGLSAQEDHIFMQPVTYDSVSIKHLAAYFGRLEKFGLYQPDFDPPSDNHTDGDSGRMFPEPHNAPRLSVMDNFCWEIKWDHRDDCVSALTTLRRVPHLTVTWAHQPSSSSSDFRHQTQNHYVPHSAPIPYLRQPLNIALSMQIRSPTSFTTRQRMSSGASRDSLATGNSPGCLHQSTTTFASECLEQSSSIESTQSWSPSGLSVNHKPSSRNDFSGDRDIGTPDVERPLLTLPWKEPGFSTQLNDSTEKKVEWSSWGRVETELNNISGTYPALLEDESNPRFSVAKEESCISAITPCLGVPPVTPRTPASIYPLTPTSCENKETRRESNISKEEAEHHLQRDIDPTSLFVGGLEMFGPAAWNEDKVKQYFSRFGGLESVQVVRPFNANSGFAFIKFNNTEGPARAVLEENNRICDGRALRVQLRDCNPPRSPWRHTRGRTRFPQHGMTPRRFNYVDRFSGRTLSHRNQSADSSEVLHPEVSCAGSAEMGNESIAKRSSESSPHTAGEDVAPQSPTPPGNLEGQGGKNPSKRDEQIPNYREWYDELELNVNKPPSSTFAPSAPVAVIPPPAYPYMLPNNPYYAHTPWMPPYISQAQYPMHYYGGYPIYPPMASPVSQALNSPSGSDASGPVAGSQHTWSSVGMYGPPYHPYHMPRNPSMDQGQPQHVNGVAIQNGFQNEHPTLVGVCQPDGIDQYITGGSALPQGSHASPLNPNIQAWAPYSHPFTARVPLRPLLQSTASMSWVPNQPSHATSILPSPSMASNAQRHSSPFLAMEPRHDSPHPSTPRRQGNRRDSQFPAHGRNNTVQPFGRKNSRNYAPSQGYNNDVDNNMPARIKGSQSALLPSRDWVPTR